MIKTNRSSKLTSVSHRMSNRLRMSEIECEEIDLSIFDGCEHGVSSHQRVELAWPREGCVAQGNCGIGLARGPSHRSSSTRSRSHRRSSRKKRARSTDPRDAISRSYLYLGGVHTHGSRSAMLKTIRASRLTSVSHRLSNLVRMLEIEHDDIVLSILMVVSVESAATNAWNLRGRAKGALRKAILA